MQLSPVVNRQEKNARDDETRVSFTGKKVEYFYGLRFKIFRKKISFNVAKIFSQYFPKIENTAKYFKQFWYWKYSKKYFLHIFKKYESIRRCFRKYFEMEIFSMIFFHIPKICGVLAKYEKIFCCVFFYPNFCQNRKYFNKTFFMYFQEK